MLIAIADMIAQKNQGRKRSIVTDTQGSCLRWSSPPLQAPKNACGFLVLRRLHQCYDSVRTVWCDAGFKVTLIALALSLWQITLEVIPRPTKRFHTSETTVGCWRTFAWLSSARRLAKKLWALTWVSSSICRDGYDSTFLLRRLAKNDFPNSRCESKTEIPSAPARARHHTIHCCSTLSVSSSRVR